MEQERGNRSNDTSTGEKEVVEKKKRLNESDGKTTEDESEIDNLIATAYNLYFTNFPKFSEYLAAHSMSFTINTAYLTIGKGNHFRTYEPPDKYSSARRYAEVVNHEISKKKENKSYV